MRNAYTTPTAAPTLAQPDPRDLRALKRYLAQTAKIPGRIERAVLRQDADFPLDQFPTVEETRLWIARDLALLNRSSKAASSKWYKTAGFVGQIKDCLEHKPDSFSPQVRHWALSEFRLVSLYNHIIHH